MNHFPKPASSTRALRLVAIPRPNSPSSLSPADLEKMLARLGNAPQDIRDRAILLSFFASGLRENKLAALKIQDLDLEAGAAKIWDGKGGKDGIVMLSPPVVVALRQYLETVRPEITRAALARQASTLNAPGSSDNVFLGRWGGPLPRRTIYLRVHDIAKQALGMHIEASGERSHRYVAAARPKAGGRNESAK